MTIHLYLDLDGPVNPVSALVDPSSLGPAWPDYQVGPGGKGVISPLMVAELNQFIASYQVIAHWVSMNEELCNAWGEAAGITGSGQWPWLPTRDFRDVWGKHQSVRQHIIETRPDRAIWIDDDLADEHDAALWAARNGVLSLTPHNRHGITPAMFEQMRRFVA